MREVLSYTPAARACKAATAERWVPVTEDEINALAPEIDAAYERAVGLDKWHDESIHQLLLSQIPSVEIRRRVALHRLELDKVLDHVCGLDFGLWWNVIAPDLTDEIPKVVRIRGAHKLPKFWERHVRFAHA